MLCILYVNAVGICLGLAALFLERTLPATSSRRWVWCVVIPISVSQTPVGQRFLHDDLHSRYVRVLERSLGAPLQEIPGGLY